MPAVRRWLSSVPQGTPAQTDETFRVEHCANLQNVPAGTLCYYVHVRTAIYVSGEVAGGCPRSRRCCETWERSAGATLPCRSYPRSRGENPRGICFPRFLPPCHLERSDGIRCANPTAESKDLISACVFDRREQEFSLECPGRKSKSPPLQKPQGRGTLEFKSGAKRPDHPPGKLYPERSRRAARVPLAFSRFCERVGTCFSPHLSHLVVLSEARGLARQSLAESKDLVFDRRLPPP